MNGGGLANKLPPKRIILGGSLESNPVLHEKEPHQGKLSQPCFAQNSARFSRCGKSHPTSDCKWPIKAALVDAALELVGTGVDFDFVADFDKGSDWNFISGGQFGRLHDLAGGVATYCGFGIDDFAHDDIGHFD